MEKTAKFHRPMFTYPTLKEGKLKSMKNCEYAEMVNQVSQRQMIILRYMREMLTLLRDSTNKNNQDRIKVLNGKIGFHEQVITEFRQVCKTKFRSTIPDHKEYLDFIKDKENFPYNLNEVEEVKKLNAEEQMQLILQKEPDAYEAFVRKQLLGCNTSDLINFLKPILADHCYGVRRIPVKD